MRLLRDRWTFASLATLVYWLAHQALRPFITVRLDELGADTAGIGIVVAVHAIGAFLLAIPIGGLTERWGLRRVLTASTAVMAGTGLLYPLATGLPEVAALEGLNGVGTLGVWICLQSLVTHVGEGERRRRHLSVFSLAWGVGLAAGPSIGGLAYEHLGFTALCAGYAALSAVVVAAVAPVPRPEDDRDVPVEGAAVPLGAAVREIASRAPVQVVLLSSFVMLYVQSIRQSFYPLYLERAGFSVSEIGALLTVIGVTSIAVRGALVPVTRLLGPRRMLVVSSGLAVVGMAVTPALGTLPLLALAAGLVGAGQGLNAPVTVELMAAHTTRRERGMGMALRLMSNRLAGIAQPVVFGMLGGALGLASAFPLSGGLLGGLTVWVWGRSAVLDDPGAAPT